MFFMKTEYAKPAESVARAMFSPAQFHTLSILYQRSAVPMSELAGELKISKQQLTPLIAKLIDNHMAVRIPDEHDRRVVKIEMTPEGRLAYQRIGAEIKQNLMNRLKKIPEADLLELEQLLSRINEILQRLP